MLVLVLNAGSSTLKFSLIETGSERTRLQATLDFHTEKVRSALMLWGDHVRSFVEGDGERKVVALGPR